MTKAFAIGDVVAAHRRRRKSNGFVQNQVVFCHASLSFAISKAMIDLSKLELNPVARDRETDPIKIFNSLTLRGEIQGLFGPQQEALVSWHKCRTKPDVLFSLNTGGGKTLVGLLAAQSLVNATNGQIVYACPTNQLVEQTAA